MSALLDERRSPPAAIRGASSVSDDSTSLPPATLENPKAIARAYAVLFLRRDDRIKRQVYLSLHSATKALERSERAGRDARMVLVELVPVAAALVVVVGGEEL